MSKQQPKRRRPPTMQEQRDEAEVFSDHQDASLPMLPSIQANAPGILRELMKEMKLTQGKMAEKLETDATYLSRILSKRLTMGVEMARRMGRLCKESKDKKP